MRLIKECPVLAVPRTKGENTLALSIVKQAADIRGKEIVYTDFSMTRDKEVLNKNYDRIAGLLAEYLEKGQNVAMLNIGDISIYSTFSYVGERVARTGFPVRVCAGVPCFCDIAAKTGKPLVSGSQVLMVIPAGKEALDPYMELEGTKVLMKSGGKLENLRRYLEEKGLEDRAVIAGNCGLPGEHFLPASGEIPEGSSYFTTVVVK